MNQSKFSLADVLAMLAALAFGFVCFMGANFLNINNDKVWGMPHTIGCIVMALIIALLLFGTAFGAKILKRTSRNFKTCFLWEVVLLILFMLFAVFFATKASPFPHYFTVTAQKSEINSKLKTSITQAGNMFVEYEAYAGSRENLYENTLKRVAGSQKGDPKAYTDFGFVVNSGIPDALQIKTKMFTVHADLFPTNYSDTIAGSGIKEVASKWLQDAKNTTSSWKPIGIVGVVNDVEKNSNDWLNTLVTLSQIREQGEKTADFEYPLSFDDVKTQLITLGNPTPLSIGLAVLAYLLMLLSWFVTKRDSRSTGSSKTATYEVVL